MLFRLNFAKGLDNKYLVFIDQVLLSAVNFGSILVLSKIASVGVFGSFVVTYSYAYFIFIFSTLLISGPILVFLAKKWEERAGNYLIASLFLNLLVNLILSLTCFFFLKNQIEGVSFHLFLLLPLGMTFFDIVKKFTFSSNEVPLKYALTSTTILTTLFFSLLFFFRNKMELQVILNIYWISFVSGSLFLLGMIFFKKNIRKNTSLPLSELFGFGKKVWQTHFRYAKWIILGGVAFWGYSQGIYILAKTFHVDDFSIGKVRTIQNLLGVFSILLVAMENQYTPIFARNDGQGYRSLIAQTFKENYLKIGGLFVLALPIGMFMYKSLYGEKFGAGFIVFLIFWALQFVLVAVKPLSIFLKSVESTKPFFVSHAVAATSVLILFPILNHYKSPYALPISMLIANLLYVGYIVGCCYYLLKNPKPE